MVELVGAAVLVVVACGLSFVAGRWFEGQRLGEQQRFASKYRRTP